ncbi:MAG: septum formation initiator family protein [Patescibacteria group bacterium]
MSKLFFNPLTTLIISLLVIVFWLSLYQTTQEIRSSDKDTQAIRDHNADLTLEIQSLETKISSAKNPNTREKVLRDEFLMQKEGEYILKLPDIELIEIEAEEEKHLSAWEEWQGLLF